MDGKRTEFVTDAGGVIVSRRIMSGESPLKWAFRETPTNPADNGWRFFAEGDDDAFINTPGNLEVVDFNTVAAVEPAIIGISLFPVGSDLQLVREADGRLVFYDNETGRPVPL
ncbi:DUF2185 domain-containing protein [Leucobacter massiliensis]|uniref:Immunity protein Imm33 domain-containing protein n=1 Tax=Leucobacter massiliensis TaxID=1686285 RepID=A0A2S9QKG9_9MICO|nr:DUF2185 domain-containing protein [Leucobacter massiliensis]PRI10091.1 hypothetical protein B4915_13210 [Leucobacter massiliensis]